MENNIKDLFYVAEITSAHGVMGEVKIALLSDRPNRLAELSAVQLISKDEKKILGTYHLESLRGHANEIIKFVEVSDRDEALRIKGAFLAISRENTYDLENGEYFIKDLLNLEVFDVANTKLGIIKDIVESAASELFIIERKGKKDLILPAIPENTVEVNLAEGKIIVNLPKGLLEVYE